MAESIALSEIREACGGRQPCGPKSGHVMWPPLVPGMAVAMMAGSHVALGVAAWFAAAPLMDLPAMDPICLGLAVAGSLLPDIDHPKSWVGRRIHPLSDFIAAIVSHRGATHSALAAAACWWFLFHDNVPRVTVAPILVGYLSHLAGDLLTPRGLRLAWPFKGTWSLPLCRAGSPFEPLVVLAVLAGTWWFMAAGPQTRQAIVGAARACEWSVPGIALCQQSQTQPSPQAPARKGRQPGAPDRAVPRI